jgi:hypothetical protein
VAQLLYKAALTLAHLLCDFLLLVWSRWIASAGRLGK